MSTRRVTRSASKPSLGSAIVATVNGSTVSLAQATKSSTTTTTTASKSKTVAKGKGSISAPSLKSSRKKSTSKAEPPGEQADADAGATPSSKPPPRKRQKKSSVPTPAPAEVTSTPSPPHEGPQPHDEPKLDALAEQHVLEDEEHEPRPQPERPAEPNGTNATLQTPRGSHVVAYRAETLNESPKQPAAPKTVTTKQKKSRKSTEAAPRTKRPKLTPPCPCPRRIRTDCSPTASRIYYRSNLGSSPSSTRTTATSSRQKASQCP